MVFMNNSFPSDILWTQEEALASSISIDTCDMEFADSLPFIEEEDWIIDVNPFSQEISWTQVEKVPISIIDVYFKIDLFIKVCFK